MLSEDEDGNVTEEASLSIAPKKSKEYAFADTAGVALRELTDRWRIHTEAAKKRRAQDERADDEVDTFIVPVIQMGPMAIRQETDAMPLLFEAIEQQEEPIQETLPAAVKKGRLPAPRATIDFTSGYFSLYPLYKSLILKAPTSIRTRIITAAPISNGFFGSKGISRHLPPAYTWLESKFWDAVKREGKKKSIEIREWERDGWTYHSKGECSAIATGYNPSHLTLPLLSSLVNWTTGVWHTSSTQSAPTLTLIGSSNFGSRSALRDLECTLLIETAPSSSLSRSLKKEIDALRGHATVPVNTELFRREDRKVHWGVKLATELIKGRL